MGELKISVKSQFLLLYMLEEGLGSLFYVLNDRFESGRLSSAHPEFPIHRQGAKEHLLQAS